ncbi:TlpA family protein disulfide reductase [Winogradskyella aurantia]|uniref:Thiol-disulfide oxidoreductase n=1 Tax=Winogradskyella aurantia TaxID=1915063 RepID=A0A265UQX3_9FLAO|nr:TlpA disulfide reductase family protein [Winogradskyella aurantia]OZV67699.1 thiol-disulfide oxidoreductase [Winogradskyella aurantia]
MKSSLLKKSNIVLLLVLALLIIPQSRQVLQIWLFKGWSFINKSNVIEEKDRVSISDYNWDLVSEDGKNFNFKETQGEVVFINFWATWCPPCIAEMPSLQKLYTSYGNRVVFLFITNDDFKVVRRFKDKNNYNFKVYQPMGAIPDELMGRTIPRTFIINKMGEIIVDERGVINWNSEAIRKQLNKLLSVKPI